MNKKELEQLLQEKACLIQELQNELEEADHGIIFLTVEIEQLLAEKARLVEELQSELEETNHGIILLTMELEELQKAQLQEGMETISQLQDELIGTNEGLNALTAELNESEEMYRSILENATEAIFTFTEEGLTETINPAASELFGYEEYELVGMSIGSLIPEFNSIGSLTEIRERIKQINSNGETFVFGLKKSGALFPIEFTLGNPIYRNKPLWMAIIRDITERKKAEASFRLMAKIFEGSNDAIVITDTKGTVIDTNVAFTVITGYSKSEIIGKHPSIMKSDQHNSAFYFSLWRTLLKTGSWNGEIWARRKNGSIYPKWLSIYTVKGEYNETTHFVGIFTDITARKEAENRLKQLAHFDPLTGLPNRALFLERLKWSLEMAKRNKKQVALMFLDLDRFKLVNDTLGHQAGDSLLIEVARRLEGCVRGTDTVSRLAGDEFTVILTNINTPDDARIVAHKILNSFAPPVLLEGRDVFISTSIGITTFPVDSTTIDQLLKNADTAMYHAKELGRNNYQFFSGFMNQKVLDELEMETNLRNALKNGEFLLHYQPQIDLETDKIIGVEVLIRWNRPLVGFVSPARFIPHAEKTDLIITIGEWVLRTACTQCMEWQKEGIMPLRISVNLSGTQLKRHDLLLETVNKILSETQLPPDMLELELTEGVIMENAEVTINTLHKLKSMGIRLSIDDFGTGYSSLSYLKRFPIDTLKIDKSFINDITTNSDDYAIASTIIAMAHNLRLKVIAEGVETKEQLDMLRDKDCDEVQGYYFSHPLPEHELKQFLKSKIGSDSA